MIAPPNLIEYQKLKDWYMRLSSFIRSLDNYTDMNRSSDFGQVLSELQALRKKLDLLIVEMDAFEQIDLVATTSREKTRMSNEQYIKVRNRGE